MFTKLAIMYRYQSPLLKLYKYETNIQILYLLVIKSYYIHTNAYFRIRKQNCVDSAPLVYLVNLRLNESS